MKGRGRRPKIFPLLWAAGARDHFIQLQRWQAEAEVAWELAASLDRAQAVYIEGADTERGQNILRVMPWNDWPLIGVLQTELSALPSGLEATAWPLPSFSRFHFDQLAKQVNRP